MQIDRAKKAGASIILLIVAALTDDELAEFHAYALASGLEVLVEVHDGLEMQTCNSHRRKTDWCK